MSVQADGQSRCECLLSSSVKMPEVEETDMSWKEEAERINALLPFGIAKQTLLLDFSNPHSPIGFLYHPQHQKSAAGKFLILTYSRMVFEDKGGDGVEDSGMEFWEKESASSPAWSFLPQGRRTRKNP